MGLETGGRICTVCKCTFYLEDISSTVLSESAETLKVTLAGLSVACGL